jgi:hypothetical protein
VNERIRAVNATLGVAAGPYAVLCECGDPECTERVTVPGDVYDVVRADIQHFLVAPGHELPDEQIIAQETSYRVVEFALLTQTLPSSDAEPAPAN